MGGAAVGGAVAGGAAAAAARVRVYEQELYEHMPGRVWTLGQQVHVRRAGGGLAVGRIDKIARCRGRQGGGAVRSRPGCFVLLLARDGSHGLDLSMVTNLFLLDKIWDPAVEKQVVARASRLGATASVSVEQLVMAGTVEQTLYELHVAMHGGAAERSDAVCGGEGAGGASRSGGGGGEEEDGGADSPAPNTPSPLSNASRKRPRGASWDGLGTPNPAHLPTSDAVSPGASDSNGVQPSPPRAQRVQQPLARASGATPAHDAGTLRALLSSMRFIR